MLGKSVKDRGWVPKPSHKLNETVIFTHLSPNYSHKNFHYQDPRGKKINEIKKSIKRLMKIMAHRGYTN
jgi:hypothetical protein